ncbi:hypothetical protein C8F04DRAFT_1177211 [Mycena alexandri]|uniref:Uncharacterized protein n=1 Tax=Mycena alexandri TaxID=1745969 RepID=A0AAD6XAJ4_9AGAR|nr:hypothetical protein C8F04DRAFT_1177211 [Mycena alexandri]
MYATRLTKINPSPRANWQGKILSAERTSARRRAILEGQLKIPSIRKSWSRAFCAVESVSGHRESRKKPIKLRNLRILLQIASKRKEEKMPRRRQGGSDLDTCSREQWKGRRMGVERGGGFRARWCAARTEVLVFKQRNEVQVECKLGLEVRRAESNGAAVVNQKRVRDPASVQLSLVFGRYRIMCGVIVPDMRRALEEGLAMREDGVDARRKVVGNKSNAETRRDLYRRTKERASKRRRLAEGPKRSKQTLGISVAVQIPRMPLRYSKICESFQGNKTFGVDVFTGETSSWCANSKVIEASIPPCAVRIIPGGEIQSGKKKCEVGGVTWATREETEVQHG